MQLKITRDLIIEWSSTVVLLAGVALTALNIFPLNIYVNFVGNMLWLATGLLWRKWSLVVVSTIISVMYGAGIMKYWFNW